MEVMIMEEIKGAIAESVKSVVKQPLMALLLIIFLVQSYIMVNKLDTINETLVAIHKDNVRIEQYIDDERMDTAKFILKLEELTRKIDLVYENVKK